MKKHSLLTLLPFALIVTGCSGNFSKGSVFNEKFMKYNFGEEIHEELSFEGFSKVELALGDDIVSVATGAITNGLMRVEKSGEKYGLFSVVENKYVLPVEKWESSGVRTGTSKHVLVYGVTKVDEENKNFKVFNEHGDQVCAGAYHGGDFEVEDQAIGSRNLREENESYRSFLKVDGILRNVIVYNVDGSIKETIEADKFLEANPYYSTWGTASKAEYGHKELLFKEKETTNGKKVVVFNKEKDKIVSQFVIPTDVIAESKLIIGDYHYYQRQTKLNDRETKFDLFDGTSKYNVETFRVNYLTGKTESVATSFFLKGVAGETRPLYDKKGFLTLQYLEGVKEIRKDKSLGEPRSVIVNESLKEVADVSGIKFTKDNIKPFSDGLYLDIESKVVYDKEFKEVAYYKGTSETNRVITLEESCGKALLDVNGKIIFGGLNVANITPLRVKDHYKVDYVAGEHKFEIVKIVNEQAEVVAGFNTKEHTLVGVGDSGYQEFASKAIEQIKDKESKVHYLDVTTGAITDAIKIEDGSSGTAYGMGSELFGGSIKVDISICQRDSNKSCYAFRDATKVALSYPVFEK